MGAFFPARIIITAIVLALLYSAPASGRDSRAQREPERGDGKYMSLSLNNVAYIINPDLDDWTALIRSDAAVYLSRGNERTYLGDIDLDNPDVGADVIVLDADFDGRPEFLLKFDSSDTNQYY